MILLLLVSLAEALISAALSWQLGWVRGYKKASLIGLAPWCSAVWPSLSLFGRLARVSVQHDSWLPKGRKWMLLALSALRSEGLHHFHVSLV